MSDTTRDLLVRLIAAAKAGEESDTQRYFDWLMRLDASTEEKKEAWLWMSEVCSDRAQKRKYIEEVLANDLWDSRARRALAILDGKLKVNEIVDPNQPVSAATAATGPVPASRFTCPKCGGRMAYSADGRSLVCEYCLSRERTAALQKDPAAAEESDFIIGLATARGNIKPVAQQTVTCQGCGAEFIIPPGQMSQDCPYCLSAHVLTQTNVRHITAPNGIIPFSVSAERARLTLKNWFEQQDFDTRPKVAPGQCMYLPVWCFDMGGHITIRCQTEQAGKWADYTEQRVVQQRDIVVPATRRLPETLKPALQRFDLSQVAPYQERYLVSWPAETYQISMADASLQARQITYAKEKQRIQETFEYSYRNLSFSSAGLAIESYQLILLPVWMTRYRLDERIFSMLINGQNAEVLAERP